MNCYRKLIRISPIFVGLICILNLVVVTANHLGLGETISLALEKRGFSRIDWLRVLIQQSLGGFLFGELSCMALWFNLSTFRLRSKIPIYFVVAVLIAVMLVGSDGTNKLFEIDFEEFLTVVGASIGLLVLTSVALRVCVGPVRIAPVSQEIKEHDIRGAAIPLGFFIMTVVAISLTASACKVDFSLVQTVTELIYVSCVMGVLPTASLLVAVSIKRLPIQICMCAVLAAMSSVLADEVSRSQWEYLIKNIVFYTWVAFLPVLWIRITRKSGYVIRSTRQAKLVNVEHPFIDTDSGAK